MKHLLQNQEFQLDEILFEKRNKIYGAYVLRSESDRTLTKAMFAGIFLFVVISSTPFILNSFKKPVEKIPIPQGPIILRNIPESPEKEPEIVKTTKPEKMVKLDIPKPTKDPKKETPATPLSKANDAKIGTENIEGEKPKISDFPIAPHTPTIPVIPTTPVAPVDNSPKERVDVEAVFNGGINAFRSKVVQNFDTTEFEGTGDIIKTTITFIVEKDGTISGIKADGSNAVFNQEAIKTIKSIKGKWIPAKLKGDLVRSYFRFPISMQFE